MEWRIILKNAKFVDKCENKFKNFSEEHIFIELNRLDQHRPKQPQIDENTKQAEVLNCISLELFSIDCLYRSIFQLISITNLFLRFFETPKGGTRKSFNFLRVLKLKHFFLLIKLFDSVLFHSKWERMRWKNPLKALYCCGLFAAAISLYSAILSRVCWSFCLSWAISLLTFFRVSRMCSSDLIFLSSTKINFSKVNKRCLRKDYESSLQSVSWTQEPLVTGWMLLSICCISCDGSWNTISS